MHQPVELVAARRRRGGDSDGCHDSDDCTGAGGGGGGTVTSLNVEATRPARADIQAIDRVGQILSLFVDDTSIVTTNGVATTLGFNRTTAHRYLTSMAAEDLLLPCTAPAGYRLGSLVLRLGGLTIGRHRVAAIASERMARLADEIGATISLSLWTPLGPAVAAVAESQGREIVLTYKVGLVLPLDTAQGAVFLAFRRDTAESEAALATLDEPAQTITRSKVAEVRRTGLSTSVTESTGTCGLAAPIFDGSGVCAALAVVDVVSSLSSAAFPQRLALLQEAANALTTRLGGRVPATIG